MLRISGFKELSNICNRVVVLQLPWMNPENSQHDETSEEQVNHWIPEINNLLIKCATEGYSGLENKEFAIRMLLSTFDVKYLQGDKVDWDKENIKTGIKLDKICIFKPDILAQSIVEACQLFFHYEGLHVYIESNSTNDLYHNSFIVPNNVDFKMTGFVDMTNIFKEKLSERLGIKHKLFSKYYLEERYDDDKFLPYYGGRKSSSRKTNNKRTKKHSK